MRGNVYRPVLGLTTRRMRAEKVATLPISVWTNGTRLEAASAIGTDVVEDLVSALKTSGFCTAARLLPRASILGSNTILQQ